MEHSLFVPDEDYNDSICYTDPRGAAKFKHYAVHTDQYIPEGMKEDKFWWAIPVICAGLCLVTLAVFR